MFNKFKKFDNNLMVLRVYEALQRCDQSRHYIHVTIRKDGDDFKVQTGSYFGWDCRNVILMRSGMTLPVVLATLLDKADIDTRWEISTKPIRGKFSFKWNFFKARTYSYVFRGEETSYYNYPWLFRRHMYQHKVPYKTQLRYAEKLYGRNWGKTLLTHEHNTQLLTELR